MQEQENTEQYSKAELEAFVNVIKAPGGDPLPIVVGSVQTNYGGTKPDLEAEYGEIFNKIKNIDVDQELSLEDQKTILDCIKNVVSKLETQNSKKVGLFMKSNNFDDDSSNNILNARKKVDNSIQDIEEKLEEQRQQKEKEEQQQQKEKEEQQQQKEKEEQQQQIDEEEPQQQIDEEAKEAEAQAVDIQSYKTGKNIYDMYIKDPVNFEKNLTLAIANQFNKISTANTDPKSKASSFIDLDIHKAKGIASKINEKLQACFEKKDHLEGSPIPDFQTENFVASLGRFFETLLHYVLSGKDNRYQQEYELKAAEKQVDTIIKGDTKAIMSL